MGPYEAAIENISKILDNFDFSGLPSKEELLDISINDHLEVIEYLYTGLQNIHDIIENIGGL